MAVAVETRTIDQLPEMVDGLSGDEAQLFHGPNKILEVRAHTGELDLGGLPFDGLDKQLLIEPYNPWNHNRVVFNRERARRLPEPGDLSQLRLAIASTLHRNQFCNYQQRTPQNRFNDQGRIEGRYNVTTASLYMSAQTHGILIFDHDPLAIPSEAIFFDRYEVADQWHEAAEVRSPEAVHHSIVENKLKKAGGTVDHGHAQMAARPGRHEGDMEEYLDNADWYYVKTGGRNYFDDLYRAHQIVGLDIEVGSGIQAFASLTPKKEAEVVVFADRFDLPTRRFLYKLYGYFMDRVSPAFNLMIGFRPPSYNGRDWGKVPGVVISIVSRGDPTHENSDIGGFEMMGTKIISTDPNRIKQELTEVLAA